MILREPTQYPIKKKKLNFLKVAGGPDMLASTYIDRNKTFVKMSSFLPAAHIYVSRQYV